MNEFFQDRRKNNLNYKVVISTNIVLLFSKRNSAIRSPVNSHQYTFTNSTIPNTEPIVNNSIFDDLSCSSGESLVDYHIIYFKDITFLFNY